MKNILKKSISLTVIAMLVMFSTGKVLAAGASASDSVTTTAIIVAPLSISGTQDLHFGKIAQPAANGTATITPAGGNSGTVDWADTSLIRNASFDVNGEPNSTITVALPNTYTITGAGDPMSVDNFTSDSGATLTLDASGEGTINVGATLSVGADQSAGTYTNSNGLEVTVSY